MTKFVTNVENKGSFLLTSFWTVDALRHTEYRIQNKEDRRHTANRGYKPSTEYSEYSEYRKQ